MLSNIRPLVFHPPHSTSEGGELESLKGSMSSLVHSIISENGEIDFSVLMRFFQGDCGPIESYFEKEERIPEILFPFLDHLKATFFSENKTIPVSVMTILTENSVVRDGVFSYVKKHNDQVMTMEHTEQDNTVSFHLLLLGGKDFNLRADIEKDHLIMITSLFADVTSRINDLGIAKKWHGDSLPVVLERELNGFIILSETINKLALICAANFEAMQISLRLGGIIRGNVSFLMKKLNTSVFNYSAIGQKLQFLSGKVQCNFAHGAPIDGTSPHEVEKQVLNIVNELENGFALQENCGFGGDETEYYSSMMICEGNRAVTKLLGIKQIEKIQGFSSDELSLQKKKYLQALYDVYNFGVNKKLATGQEVLLDFVQKNIEHEHQIEAVYYIVLFDPSINEDTLLELIDFFYPGRIQSIPGGLGGVSQMNNFFYEEFIIKIMARIIRKLHASPRRGEFVSFVDWIYTSIENKNISHSILSYSKVCSSLGFFT